MLSYSFAYTITLVKLFRGACGSKSDLPGCLTQGETVKLFRGACGSKSLNELIFDDIVKSSSFAELVDLNVH